MEFVRAIPHNSDTDVLGRFFARYGFKNVALVENERSIRNMRKATLSRPQKMQFPLIKGNICLDGSDCAQVKAGKEVTFEIPDGAHEIQVYFASVPPTSSNVLSISELDEALAFEVKIIVPLKGGATTAQLTKK